MMCQSEINGKLGFPFADVQNVTAQTSKNNKCHLCFRLCQITEQSFVAKTAFVKSTAATSAGQNKWTWMPWKLVLPSHFISWKSPFLILTGSGFYQIWLWRLTEVNSQPIALIVLVNSHQRWKQTRNRVCFHLWCDYRVSTAFQRSKYRNIGILYRKI